MGILTVVRDLAAGFKAGSKVSPLEWVSGEITAIEEALAQVGSERAAAEEVLARADADLDMLLLRDASAAEKAAQRTAMQEAQDTLRALELFQGVQERRLAELKGERRRLVFADFGVRWHRQAVQVAEALREAQDEAVSLISIVDEARRAGFEHEALAAFPPPPAASIIVSLAEPLDRWTADIAVRDPAAPKAPAPSPRPGTAPPSPRPAAPRNGIAVRLDDAPPVSPRAQRTRPPAPVPGGVPVRVLRDGYPAHDGTQCFVGDEITLPPDIAKVAASNGAVEILPRAGSEESP